MTKLLSNVPIHVHVSIAKGKSSRIATIMAPVKAGKAIQHKNGDLTCVDLSLDWAELRLQLAECFHEVADALQDALSEGEGA